MLGFFYWYGVAIADLTKVYTGRCTIKDKLSKQ